MLPLRARLDLGAMTMKEYSAFPKASALCWNLTIRLFSVIYRTLVGGGCYPSAEIQSVYSTAPVDWAIHRFKCQTVLFQIIQFSISTQFRRQKTVLFRAIQFSTNTQFQCQNSSISNNSV